MLEPMTAAAYADSIMLQIYDYYNTSFSTNDFMNLEETRSTYTEKSYSFEQNGIPYTVIVITATDLTQYTQSLGNYSDTMVEMIVPYVYIYCAPFSEIDSGRGNFDLFLSNTRVSDEFNLVKQKMSLALENAITSGTTANIDDQEISEILGTGDGTYSSEEFCDYILSQNSYTTSDGKEVKIPNSYDYVYEGENGNIYASNSTDQPAGSTRLYSN